MTSCDKREAHIERGLRQVSWSGNERATSLHQSVVLS
jgi:hypothetical protein